MALKSDGTIWVWGNNSGGQLGDNSTTHRHQAVQVAALTNVIAISGGWQHSMALKKDGTVWAWGGNWYGQLGNNSTNASHVPAQVQDGSGNYLRTVTEIGANRDQSYALLQDTSVKGWGYLLDGSGTTDALVPVTVVDGNNVALSQVKKISRGKGNHLLAIKTDGTAWAGGFNFSGELNDGSTTSKPYAVQVYGLDGSFLGGVIDVSAGEYHSLALLSTGKVISWGDNAEGQLGTGTTQNSAHPVQVIHPDSTPVTTSIHIATGDSHVVSLQADRTLLSWGSNSFGSLGNDSRNHSSTATPVLQADGTPLSDIISVAAGGGFTLALKSDGTVWAWGNNWRGQLGNDSNTDSAVPVQILCDYNASHPPLADIIAIAAGRYFGMALDSSNNVWTWGSNSSGQLGDGTTDSRNFAHQIPTFATVTAIAAGDSHALALKSDYQVAAWGGNYAGQLGTENYDDALTPQGVRGKYLGTSYIINSIAQISAKGAFSMALKTDGTLLTWGDNRSGQLASLSPGYDRNYADYAVDNFFASLSGVTGITAGTYHVLAIQNSQVLAWGDNYEGQLGNGTLQGTNIPTPIISSDGSTFNNAVQVSAGPSSSVIRKADGTLWSIGSDYYGELGDGSREWKAFEVKNFLAKGNFPWTMFLPGIINGAR